MSEKLAVLFPGVGYHVDRPLLYHSAKLARERGYEVCTSAAADRSARQAGEDPAGD